MSVPRDENPLNAGVVPGSEASGKVVNREVIAEEMQSIHEYLLKKTRMNEAILWCQLH